MKTVTFAVIAVFLAGALAHAQQMQSGGSITAQVALPIPGIDDAGLAGGARASKLIGSKV
jgi:hypothetical protein